MKDQNVITAALAVREGLEGELSGLQRLAGETETKLAKLEIEVNLADAAAMAEIGRLRILAGLLPRRLAHREEALGQAERNVQSACEDFVSGELGPKCRDLVKRAIAKTTVALKAHFSAQLELDEAVSRSALVQEANKIAAEARIEGNPIDGPVAYAQRLLGAWAAAAESEKKLK